MYIFVLSFARKPLFCCSVNKNEDEKWFSCILWRTKKQTRVALSSTKDEYVATTQAAKEGLWLKSILLELDVIKLSHIKMYCDNQSCIKIAINPKLTNQNKHHFIRDLVEMKELELKYTSTITVG